LDIANENGPPRVVPGRAEVARSIEVVVGTAAEPVVLVRRTGPSWPCPARFNSRGHAGAHPWAPRTTACVVRDLADLSKRPSRPSRRPAPVRVSGCWPSSLSRFWKRPGPVRRVLRLPALHLEAGRRRFARRSTAGVRCSPR